MSTLNETPGPTSRKYVAEQGILTEKLIKHISNFLDALLRFCFRKITWKSKFSVFFLLRNPFYATFNETRAPTSRKYLAEQGLVMRTWSRAFQTFWLHSSVFALDPLVACFNETRATTFRKCVAKEGIVITNSLKNFWTFW